jgi:hypothetical protein
MMSNTVFSDDGNCIGTPEDDIESVVSDYEDEDGYDYGSESEQIDPKPEPIRFTPSELYSMTEITEQISKNIDDILTNWKVVHSNKDGCDGDGCTYWVSCQNGWEGRSYELSSFILDDLMRYFQNLIELSSNSMLKSNDDEEFKINSDIYKFMNRNSYRLYSITSQEFMNYLTK